MVFRWVFLALLSGSLSWAQAQDNSLRDPEALYLDGVSGMAPVVLKVQALTPVYATRNLTAHVGNFVANEEVILVAHHTDSYLIRAKTGKLEGWVSPKNVSAPDPAIIKTLRAAVEEELRYQNAIQKKEVISGMTFEHVLKALGKPDNKSFREDENGRFDLWSYIAYDTQIEQRPYRNPLTGQIYMETVRVKVPVGSLDVEFKGGRVSAVEKKRDTNQTHNSIRPR